MPLVGLTFFCPKAGCRVSEWSGFEALVTLVGCGGLFVF